MGTPDRIRTCDQRLRRAPAYALFQEVAAENDQPVSPVEVLGAIVRRDAQAAESAGRALAEQVLASKPVRLAHQVLEGGPFMYSRLIELCELLDAGVAAVKRGAV
jgi:hypothetical protein